MFAHLLKGLWKRKSRNLLLSLEILLAFVVVFAIAAAAGRYWQLYRLPIGFSYDDVWSVEIRVAGRAGMPNDAALYDRFKRSLSALPEVEKVAFAGFPPYVNSTWTSDFHLPGQTGSELRSHRMQVSDDFFDTLGMTLTEGRWFSTLDDGAAAQPVVVNRQFAQAMFPGESAIGKTISDGDPGEDGSQLLTITGVFEMFRGKGEFMTPTSFAFTRVSARSDEEGLETLLLKLRPGTTRAFETRLSVLLKQIRNDWSYRIAPLRDLRAAMQSEATAPLFVAATVAAFLLLMVGFGLFGVLWQNTTRRIPEFGMRRAVGATRGAIYGQVIVEQLLLSALAMAVGLVLLAQLPITGVFGEHLGWPLFLAAALASMAVMAAISVLGALYPAWRASTLSPTQALHDE